MENIDEIVKMDQEMTDQEWEYLNSYMKLLSNGDEKATAKAIEKAGYNLTTAEERKLLGSRILAKWQGKADHKDIMRLAGLGPLQVTTFLLEILNHSKSDASRVQALNIASKCLDMQKNALDVGQGVDIIIKRSRGEGLEEPEMEREMKAQKKLKEKKVADTRAKATRKHTLEVVKPSGK